MPGINTTGLPNVLDYTVGRGIAYFARLDANNFPQEWRDLGNMPSLKTNIQTQLLEHMSSRTGIRVVDAQIVVSQKISVTLELDEFNFQNLALALAGDSETYSNSTATGGVAPTGTNTNVLVYQLGCWYDLYAPLTGEPGIAVGGDPADHRIYDIGNVTVKDHTGATTYAAGTDYYIDSKMGRIFILATGTMTANATNGVAYQVTIAANASADASPGQVQALTNAGQVGALKFIMQNPANNDQLLEFTFWKIQLIADGELALISDEVIKITLKGDAQSNPQASPNSPVLTIRTHKNANGTAGNTLANE